MARQQLIISSKLKIKEGNALGVIIDSSSLGLKDLKRSYLNKNVQIKKENFTLKGTIKSLDGYLANTDLRKINLFLILDIEDLNEVVVGDIIEVLL